MVRHLLVGQDIVDYENGVLLKKMISKMGYDGFIFQDGTYSEVVLFKPAKELEYAEIS